jgi:hypothetical protein
MGAKVIVGVIVGVTVVVGVIVRVGVIVGVRVLVTVGVNVGVTEHVGEFVGVTEFVGVFVGVGFGRPAPTLDPAPRAKILLNEENAKALDVILLFNALKSGGIAIIIFIFQYVFFLSFLFIKVTISHYIYRRPSTFNESNKRWSTVSIWSSLICIAIYCPPTAWIFYAKESTVIVLIGNLNCDKMLLCWELICR